jgi:carbamoyl-phosphate synthase large subunit
MDESFGMAFAKAQIAAGNALPLEGKVFLSVNNRDKDTLVPIARELAGLGFELCATQGTAAHLRRHGLAVESVYKVSEGRPNGADRIINGEISLVVNTPLGGRSFDDERALRQAAIAHGVPMLTTLSGAQAAAKAIAAMRCCELRVKSLQAYWQEPLEA